MINFNIPPFTGKEFEYMKEAVENQKICGDGPFTKKCDEWIEAQTGTAKCLLTTSCTHATELAALLAGEILWQDSCAGTEKNSGRQGNGECDE